jgi:hypothetical protein
MKVLKAVCLAVVLAVVLTVVLTTAAGAADISGTWSGTFKVTALDGQVLDDTVHLVLKQEGDKITGTAGPSADQQLPIQKGAIQGNRITMEVPVPNGMYKFDVTLEGDHLKGEATVTAGGETLKAKMDATRAK